MNPSGDFMIVLPSNQNQIRNATFSFDDKSVGWKSVSARIRKLSEIHEAHTGSQFAFFGEAN